MKIERINDNQIRCTLTSFDLSVRNLNIGELAYGSEKARGLFREMIQKASNEVGFEADDIPLMVEAIPLSNESVMLVITKIEDPEELDTRFSKFSDTDNDDSFSGYSPDQGGSYEAASANDILDWFQKIQQESKAKETLHKKKSKSEDFIPLDQAVRHEPKETVPSSPAIEIPVDLTKLFLIHNLDIMSKISNVLDGYYHGDNTLFRDSQSHIFYLVVHKSSHTPEEFNKVCNILSEYSTQINFSDSIEAYFNEHFDCIIRSRALQQFAAI